jgi:PST family polysaccharide transporter
MRVMHAPGTPHESLTTRTARALGFRMAGHVAVTILTIAFGVVLARLLPPAEFGLYAIAAATVEIALLLGGSGMLEALIQRRDLSPGHQAAAVAIQMGAACLLGVVLVGGAAYAEDTLAMPGLAPLMRMQALLLPVTALALLPSSRLSRDLAFGPLATAEVVFRLVSGMVAIGAAVLGAGAMSLVYGALAGTAVRTLVLWVAAPVRPGFRFRLAHVQDLYRFGAGMVVIGVANVLARRLDVLIIGARLGTVTVGLYQRAFQLLLLPLEQLLNPVTKVLFPALATVQGDRDRLRRAFLAVVRLSALVGFPLMTLVWVLGDLVIVVAYGPAWLGAAPILRLLAVSGYFRIVYRMHGLVVQASGRPLAEGLRQAVYVVLVVALTFVGSLAGIEGAVAGVVIASAIFMASMTRLALGLAGVGASEWLGAMRTGTAASVAMAGALLVTRAVVAPYFAASVLLVVTCVAGLPAYILAVRWLGTVHDREVLGRVAGAMPRPVAWSLRHAFAVASDAPVVLGAPLTRTTA